MSEFLAQINSLDGITAKFITRIEGIPVDADRLATVKRLEPAHMAVVEEMGYSWEECQRCEQVHGGEVAIVSVSGECADGVIDGVDGLISGDAGVLLGIYVADCGAIYLVDRVTGVIGLVHSGKRGTELGILTKALEMMALEFGTRASDVVVALAPCIRPPAYEVDFAAEIRRQAVSAGVRDENFKDSGICTSSDLENYYSYRSEKGATGRMLALLGRK